MGFFLSSFNSFHQVVKIPPLLGTMVVLSNHSILPFGFLPLCRSYAMIFSDVFQGHKHYNPSVKEHDAFGKEKSHRMFTYTLGFAHFSLLHPTYVLYVYHIEDQYQILYESKWLEVHCNQAMCNPLY